MNNQKRKVKIFKWMEKLPLTSKLHWNSTIKNINFDQELENFFKIRDINKWRRSKSIEIT